MQLNDKKPLLNDIKFYGPLALKGVWWGSLMHTYGKEFLSKTLTVIEFYFNFYCLLDLKSDKGLCNNYQEGGPKTRGGGLKLK